MYNLPYSSSVFHQNVIMLKTMLKICINQIYLPLCSLLCSRILVKCFTKRRVETTK